MVRARTDQRRAEKNEMSSDTDSIAEVNPSNQMELSR
jgi:hypothetical protein